MGAVIEWPHSCIFEQEKQVQRQQKIPTAGFEPAIFPLGAGCRVHWATRAGWMTIAKISEYLTFDSMSKCAFCKSTSCILLEQHSGRTPAPGPSLRINLLASCNSGLLPCMVRLPCARMSLLSSARTSWQSPLATSALGRGFTTARPSLPSAPQFKGCGPSKEKVAQVATSEQQ